MFILSSPSRPPRPGWRLTIAIAFVTLMSSVLTAVTASTASAAGFSYQTRVHVSVSGFGHLPGEANGNLLCGGPEYTAWSQVGRYGTAPVDTATTDMEGSRYDSHGWTAAARGGLDVEGPVTLMHGIHAAAEWVVVSVRIVEDSSFICGPDVPIDINPQPGSNPSALQVLSWNGVLWAFNNRDSLIKVADVYDDAGAVCRYPGLYRNCHAVVSRGWAGAPHADLRVDFFRA